MWLQRAAVMWISNLVTNVSVSKLNMSGAGRKVPPWPYDSSLSLCLESCFRGYSVSFLFSIKEEWTFCLSSIILKRISLDTDLQWLFEMEGKNFVPIIICEHFHFSCVPIFKMMVHLSLLQMKSYVQLKY